MERATRSFIHVMSLVTRSIAVLVSDSFASISVMSDTLVVVAGISTTIRGYAVEVKVGRAEGLPRTCVINCDWLVTVPKADLLERAGALSAAKQQLLDRALGFALGLADCERRWQAERAVEANGAPFIRHSTRYCVMCSVLVRDRRAGPVRGARDSAMTRCRAP